MEASYKPTWGLVGRQVTFTTPGKKLYVVECQAASMYDESASIKPLSVYFDTIRGEEPHSHVGGL
jgi:hypothetical protein